MQIFLSYKVAEIDKILLLELVTYVLSPAVFYLYVHASYKFKSILRYLRKYLILLGQVS